LGTNEKRRQRPQGSQKRRVTGRDQPDRPEEKEKPIRNGGGGTGDTKNKGGTKKKIRKGRRARQSRGQTYSKNVDQGGLGLPERTPRQKKATNDRGEALVTGKERNPGFWVGDHGSVVGVAGQTQKKKKKIGKGTRGRKTNTHSTKEGKNAAKITFKSRLGT